MNATDIIGFKADSAIYCPPCAGSKYGFDHAAQDAGIGVMDQEGNEVGTVFADAKPTDPIAAMSAVR